MGFGDRPLPIFETMTAPSEGPLDIRLRFSGVTRPHGFFVGPAPWFRVVGTSILQGPNGELVAESHDHRWKVRELVFNRLDCRQPHVLRFEDSTGQSTETIGEFGECAVIDGVIYAEGAPVANWIPALRLWRSTESEIGWPTVFIAGTATKLDYPYRFQPGRGWPSR